MKNLSKLKRIRNHCLKCSGGSRKEVRNCIITDCDLYPLRMGKDPHRKGIGNKNALYNLPDAITNKKAS